MKFEIKNRFTGKVQLVASIKAKKDDFYSLKVGLAVRWAIEHKANLSGANLSGADLSGANLTRANLSGANLSGANLTRADLSGANLSGANLTRANLSGADLSGANLSGANLSWADLSGANLSGADLSGANLSWANLSWANLSGANNEKITIKKIPIQIATGEYHVIIFDAHMKIGCEFHSLADWWNFDNERIAQMDGTRSRRFWDTWKALLMAVCEANGRK